MINLKTFTMQIIDCDPEGIKICRVQGSTLVTVVVPRHLLARLKDLPDIPTRGIYYLLQLERGSLHRVYAGKTLDGITRLNSHNSQKDWWSVAVMFLAPENELSGDVVDCLEAAAIKYIRAHDGYEVDNDNMPNPYVNPYYEAYIGKLHEEVLFRMAVLGYSLDKDKADEPVGPAVPGVFHTVKHGVRGLGVYHADTGKFEVLPGSEVDLATSIIKNEGAKKARSAFLKAGNIAQKDDRSVLRAPCAFKSPSAAAVFVLGGSQNGWTEWVDADGRTLAEVYRTDAEG